MGIRPRKVKLPSLVATGPSVRSAPPHFGPLAHVAMVPAPMHPMRPNFPSVPSAFRAFLVVTAVLCGPGAHAQNAPPPMTGPSWGPSGTTVSQAAVASGGLTVSVGVMNPHLGGSPLWLWLEADGQGEVRLV